MSECLIDFDPYPKLPPWDISFGDWDPHEDFCDIYERARKWRIADRQLFLRIAMCERILSEDEESEAHDFGLELAGNCDYRLLSDLWFQQRRLKALKKGLLLK